MLPDGVLSTDPHPDIFIGARSKSVTRTIDHEDGGIAINDASEGLLYQSWRARLWNAGTEHSYVDLSADNTEPFRWIELAGMSEISFSFDANMRPVVAFVQSGSSFLNWYDPVASDYVTTSLGSDVVTPRVSMDDKRFLGSAGYSKSSVILAYIKNGNLYYRDQIDRFATEYLLKAGVKPLIKIGMNRNLRMQFMSEI